MKDLANGSLGLTIGLAGTERGEFGKQSTIMLLGALASLLRVIDLSPPYIHPAVNACNKSMHSIISVL